MRWRLATIGLAAAALAAGAGGAVFWRAGARPNPSPEIANPFLPPGEADCGWPFIRGADCNGHSPEINLADAWPPGGPPVVWRRPLGEGYSSLVARGGRVYTQYQDASGQFVVCLHAATGETVWRYRYDWPFGAGEMYPGPRATPTLAHGRVYFAAPSGLIGCLNDRGRLVWSLNVTEQFDGQGTGFGYACSLTVVDELVILPVGGKGAAMIALDAHDGSLVWRDGDQSASYMPAYPITVDGQRQVVGYMENTIVGHELTTGEQLWVHELSKGYDEHAAWPIFHDGHLWIAAPFHVGSELLSLSGGQGASAVSVRQSKLMSNDVASSVLVDEHIYGFDLRETQTKPGRPSRGTFRCIDFHTGEVRWSQGDVQRRRRWPPRDSRNVETGPPIGHVNFFVADGKMILLNDTGELILARATPERYEELGRATVLPGEICWTSPALHRGCVFVRNHREAACVYVGRPELFDQIRLAEHSPSSAAWMNNIPALPTMFGVRASDRTETPTIGRFARWYGLGLAIIAVTFAATGAIGLSTRSPGQSRATFLTCAALFGVAGPVLFGRWLGEFTFTWPVALFAVLLATVDHVPLTHTELSTLKRRWHSPLAVAALFAISAAYFFACRELGLPALTIFLTGFAAALPVAALAKLMQRRTPLPWYAELLLLAASFSAYYWTAVALLFWRGQQLA